MIARLSARFMIPLFFSAIITIALGAEQSSAPNPTSTSITYRKSDATLGDVAATLTKASGIPIITAPQQSQKRCPTDYVNIPFWEALERTAKQTGNKIVLHEKGTRIGLEPKGSTREVSTVSGPYRIVAKQVIGRELLDLGTTFHEVYLEVHWEPRIPVFRIDSQPRITKATDNRGVALASPTSTASTYPTEALTDMKVKLTGLTRESKQIEILAGEFRVTAAASMLVFKFDDLAGKTPVTKTQSQVTATLKGISKPDKWWEVELELQYPKDFPIFESFEEQKWLRDNRLQLVSPEGKPTEPESEEVAAQLHRQRVTATYRFPGNLNPLAKGWSLIYETPSPLVEMKIPFELRNIPLP
jgi:hypothetical protein